MNDRPDPRLARWPALVPFLLGDAVFLGLAWWIMEHSPHPLDLWYALALVLCVGAGAWLAVLPFLWDAKAALKVTEMETLSSTVAEIQNVQLVSTQIKSATAHWSFAQEQAQKTVEAASAIAERMHAEASSFAEFMQKANDTEKATLRLEVEKLRRAEGDWLQVLVRILDHVYALHQAGVRSGQPALIQQLGGFQAACRDVTRRIGLVPFSGALGDAFDEKLHQPADEQNAPPAGALVEETLATGFTYQGQLLRRAVVTFRAPAAPAPTAAPLSMFAKPPTPPAAVPEPTAAAAESAPISTAPAEIASDEAAPVVPTQPNLL